MTEFITGIVKEIYGEERGRAVTWGRQHKRLLFILIIVALLMVSYFPCRGPYHTLGRAIGPDILAGVIFISFLLLLVLLAWTGRHILVSNWQAVVASILLLAVVCIAYALLRTVWVVILVACLTSAILLLARYWSTTYREERGWIVGRGTLLISSGEGVGDFSYGREGPWSLAVACDPVSHGWPAMEPARWVWIKKKPSEKEAQQGQIVWHRLSIRLVTPSEKLDSATLKLMVDDWADVLVNDQRVRQRLRGFDEPIEVNIAPYLRRGKNIILMKIENADIAGSTPEQNPSGIIYGLSIACA